jgi:hypothetical protein
MVADAVAWVCRSPRRLAVFAVSLMAVILIGSHLLGGSGGSTSGKAGAGGDKGSGPVVTAAQVPDSSAFVNAAVTFVRAWSVRPDGESAQKWHDALVPLATDGLVTALTSTDPAQLPGSAPEGEPVVRFVAQDSALIAVPLANGTSVLVTVVNDGASQRVSDVQPFAGDN